MKKFAKMSLAAAVAVVGLSSTASAASLEEAIKGVDVSGQFRFRTEERSVDAYGDHSWTDVEVEVTAKVPVNDNVTAVFKLDHAVTDSDGTNGETDIGIEDYYFQYVNGPLTVQYGQQNIPGRLTDGAAGDGIVALYNAGAFTIGAAGFKDHNLDGAGLDGSKRVLSVLAMGSVGPVSLSGQYVDVDDTADSYNLKADAKFGPAMVGVEYSETDVEGVSGEDLETLKAYVSGSFGPLSAKLTYAKTGDNGSGSLHGVAEAYGDSVETPAEFLLWQTGSATKDDYKVIALDATYKITDSVSVRAAYADGEDSDVDFDETLAQVNYKMSKNLNAYVRYSQLDVDGADEVDRGRVEIKYSF